MEGLLPSASSYQDSCATSFSMGIADVLNKIHDFLDKWPGKERFGTYRFLPIFFASGAVIEFLMIHWRPNGVNFYDTFKAKKAREKALEKSRIWKEIEKFNK